MRVSRSVILALACVLAAAAGAVACDRGHSDGASDSPVPDENEGGDGDGDDDGDDGDATPASEDGPDAKYGRTVEPNVESIQRDLLDTHCVGCHSGAGAKAGLDLSDLAKRMSHPHQDGYHGQLVAPGRPKDSMLVLVMRTTNERQVMPPAGGAIPRVTGSQIASVEAWIRAMPAPPDDEPGGEVEPGEPGGGDGDDEPGDEP